MKISFKLLWYNGWVGYCWDKDNNILYLSPFFWCIFIIDFCYKKRYAKVKRRCLGEATTNRMKIVELKSAEDLIREFGKPCGQPLTETIEQGYKESEGEDTDGNDSNNDS